MEIKAAVFDGAQGCERLEPEAAIELFLAGKGFVWIHITGSEGAAALLHDRLELPDLEVEDALSDLERPSLQAREKALFLAVPAIIEDGYVEVAAWLRPAALITYSGFSVPAVALAYDRWLHRPHHVGPTPSFLLYTVLDTIVDGYFPKVDGLEDRTEDLMDAIFGGNTTLVKEILVLKREFLDFRRRVVPAREVLNGLLRRETDLIDDAVRPYFQDIYDHVLRAGELAELNRETLATLLDIHLGTVSNNLNVVLKSMTTYSLMLMAPAVVAGIYGMNFDVMPELKWLYGYPWALGLMALSSLAIYGLFYRRGWVGPRSG